MQDMQAQLVLLGVIDENQMLLVDSCTTSAQIWIKLKSLYEKIDSSSKVAAQTAFFGYTYDGTKTIVEHIAHVENLAKKLRDIGELVSEEAVMARLLHNLPETYSGLLNAWNFSAKEQQTLAKLTHELIREEARQTSAMEASTSAMAVQKNHSKFQESQPKEKKSKRNVTCFYCQKKGHYARECRLKKKNKEAKVEQAMTAENEPKSECFEVRSIVGATERRDTWLADSGATDHMVNDRAWFTKFEQYESVMSLADKSTTKVEGRGTVEFERLVNGKWLHGTMLNVLYVPSLEKNLLSVGTSVKRGFKQECDKNEIRFTLKGQLFAVGKMVENNTYKVLFRRACKTEKNIKSNCEANTVKNDLFQ